MKRTFIAIKIALNKENMSFFSDLKLKFKDSSINWVNAENMHLTLFFLGDTSDNQISAISKELALLLAELKSFTITLKGLGVFKNILDPKVMWMGIEHSEILDDMKVLVNKAMINSGFEVDNKVFKPHLTLGRIKNLTNKSALIEWIEKYRDHFFQDVLVNEIIFYESILSPKGPVYKVMKTFKLS
ncbi:MAG: RNA 2',3'-cyclic phosphodiesterase [Bacteroidales bacterium]|jgi:2'-5' RNA ligase|nr:RNA 2',3'-cyclic phosphodiesterase [Bacteroidales bacterium]